MAQFARARQMTKGRPRPGTVVAVEVSSITEQGKQDRWVLVNYFISNDPRGGMTPAEELVQKLNDAWNTYHGWIAPNAPQVDIAGLPLPTEEPCRMHEWVEVDDEPPYDLCVQCGARKG